MIPISIQSVLGYPAVSSPLSVVTAEVNFILKIDFSHSPWSQLHVCRCSVDCGTYYIGSQYWRRSGQL